MNETRGGPTAPSRGPRVRVVAGALRDDAGRVLLARRPPGGPHGGLWEFPGGKVESGETPEDALARELHEELAIAVEVGPVLTTVDHDYAHLSLSLIVYACRITEGCPVALEHQALVWVPPGEMDRYPMPEADEIVRYRLNAER